MNAAVLESVAAVRAAVAPARRAAEVVGLVPTMGALHAGHRALMRRAREDCDRVAVSLFVNPTQFDQAADLTAYPRTLDSDLKVCGEEGVDWLFAPSTSEMYPREGLTFVQVEKLTEGMCGATRSGHFRGVTTVCAKLFHIVEPHKVYFGEKDFQQLAAIRRMVLDLDFPLEVVGVPTVREADGVALSSRNRRLTEEQRLAARCLFRGLSVAQSLFAGGERDAQTLIRAARSVIDAEPLAKAEYVELADAETLEPLTTVEREARILAAAAIGDVRLIDNLALR